MYFKGKAFIGAAFLLKKQQCSDTEHVEYVVLYLLCQGIEVVLKGLLLFNNFDKYRLLLPRKVLGHNLYEIAKEVSSVYCLKPIRDELANELRTLTHSYSQNLLRYGGIGDIFIDPRTIPRDAILRRVAATIRLAEREMRRARG
jgi:hypothetical protein